MAAITGPPTSPHSPTTPQAAKRLVRPRFHQGSRVSQTTGRSPARRQAEPREQSRPSLHEAHRVRPGRHFRQRLQRSERAHAQPARRLPTDPSWRKRFSFRQPWGGGHPAAPSRGSSSSKQCLFNSCPGVPAISLPGGRNQSPTLRQTWPGNVIPGRQVHSNRQSSCPAVRTLSRSLLRSSSTHEPSDPPLGFVQINSPFPPQRQRNGTRQQNKRYWHQARHFSAPAGQVRITRTPGHSGGVRNPTYVAQPLGRATGGSPEEEVLGKQASPAKPAFSPPPPHTPGGSPQPACHAKEAPTTTPCRAEGPSQL